MSHLLLKFKKYRLNENQLIPITTKKITSISNNTYNIILIIKRFLKSIMSHNFISKYILVHFELKTIWNLIHLSTMYTSNPLKY